MLTLVTVIDFLSPLALELALGLLDGDAEGEDDALGDAELSIRPVTITW